MAIEAGPYPCWEFLDSDGEVPQSRSGHTCALHQNRYLYIFGGFDGSNCFDDLYVLDLETRHWRKITPGGERPSGRASHSAVTDELAGVMYIFGGSGSHFGYTNKRDLCEFCFKTETWRLLSNPLEDTPSARYGQSMVAYQEGLYVWGGTHGTNYPTDMHRFDLCSKQWDYVVTSGDLPCGRYRHQAMVKDDLMYIVGGSGINRYGDVFTFHFGTSVWKKLVCTGTDLSDGRYAHSAVLRDGFMYLYGGNDGVRHDDLQQLELETRVWSRVTVHGNPSSMPPGRDFHAAVLRKDSMVIFGGSNGTRRHNDVFEFHMAPKIPPCTLTSDMEALLEQAQLDEATQLSCDVFLAADGGESSQEGVFCHSHLLLARCPRLYQVFQEIAAPPVDPMPSERSAAPSMVAESILASDCDMSSTQASALGATATACTPERPVQKVDADGKRPATHSGEVASTREQEEVLDTLFLSVGTGSPGSAGASTSATTGPMGGMTDGYGVVVLPILRRPPPLSWDAVRPHARCVWVPVDVPPEILMHFVRYLYTETTRFGRVSAEQLYRLFITSKHLDVRRLSALCERQIKVRLGLDNVLSLLRASTADGPIAQPVQDACKHFFLANYNHCTELRECEALDPKLLCELMRLHNSQMVAAASGGGGTAPGGPRSAGGGTSGGHQFGSATGPASVGRTPSGMSPDEIALAAKVAPPRDTAVGSLCKQVFIPPERLAEDLKQLLEHEIAPDFEVVVQDEVIRTHKFMLVARSGYFASCILTSGMVEAQAGRLVIPPNSAMTADAFRAFLRFLYAGDDILGILAPHTAMYLVDASSFYGLTNLRLKHFCELCVKDSFNEEHVLQLFEASSRLSVEAVRAMALEFIITHFHTVCRQPALEQLDKPLLIEILKGLADRIPQTVGNPAAATAVPRSLG
mmetsp:Transcript_16906/g.37167  ORF Transcript_16906/g.37167 Transcript_16906/m.37167 type:complete len:917 (+) Transcript_16906:114-2864(+)